MSINPGSLVYSVLTRLQYTDRHPELRRSIAVHLFLNLTVIGEQLSWGCHVRGKVITKLTLSDRP